MFAPFEVDARPPAAGEIHVWTVPSQGDAEAAASLLTCLSPHERQRASRMDDAHGFIIGRAGVRTILARYLGRHPADLEVHAGTGGRPWIAGAPDTFDFSFSRCPLLHVCAVTTARRVGVDVAVRSGPGPQGADDVARRVEHDARAKALGVRPDGDLDEPARSRDVRVELFEPGRGTVAAVAGEGRWTLRRFTAQLAETGGVR